MSAPSAFPRWTVQTLDTASGAEDWVEVCAPTIEDARIRVEATGLAVGRVRLLGFDAPAPSTATAPEPHAEPSEPGATICPSCGGHRWRSARPPAFFVCYLLFFPLSVLLIPLVPKRHTCVKCQFELPTTAGRPKHATDEDAPILILCSVAAVIAWLTITSLIAS